MIATTVLVALSFGVVTQTEVVDFIYDGDVYPLFCCIIYCAVLVDNRGHLKVGVRPMVL